MDVKRYMWVPEGMKPADAEMGPEWFWIRTSDHLAALTAERDRTRGMAQERDELARRLEVQASIAWDNMEFHDMSREAYVAWVTRPIKARATQPAATPACPYDTDGDGNCGKPACPVCGPVSYHPTQAPAAKTGKGDHHEG